MDNKYRIMGKWLLFFFLVIAMGLVVYWIMIWKGMHSFLFAWILNFVLMMVVLFFTQLIKPRLESKYFNSKNWESEGKIYEWMGVNLFRKLLVLVGWEKLNKKENPVKKNSDALLHLEYSTRQSEFGHLIILLIVLAFTFLVSVRSGFHHALWLISLNILLNFYPIILQRYNRPRIANLIRNFHQKII